MNKELSFELVQTLAPADAFQDRNADDRYYLQQVELVRDWDDRTLTPTDNANYGWLFHRKGEVVREREILKYGAIHPEWFQAIVATDFKLRSDLMADFEEWEKSHIVVIRYKDKVEITPYDWEFASFEHRELHSLDSVEAVEIWKLCD